ncbi:MAG: endonuclease III [Clostridia bacterium]|nr:endonuclease III [Clostridia bacterium]MBQ2319410.1 endonuclease III [Clostridia bacterium]MBQ5597275.1 endonuclease III [Clostridia bacterium]MBQ5902351.1 endonuclease III [Clostridia bacterium]
MTKKQRADEIVRRLWAEYPVAECQLNYSAPHELLIATRLSAQCTDKRVNMVTPALFERYKSVDDFAAADAHDVEKYVKSCGLYKTKAADIVNMCISLRDNFGGRVPDTMEELTSLSGVGRKTANLILGDIFGKPAVVADTHVIRITGLLGLCDSKDPYKVEIQLKKLLNPEISNDFCHRIVLHGRTVCVARSPKCDKCCLRDVCKAGK